MIRNIFTGIGHIAANIALSEAAAYKLLPLQPHLPLNHHC